ncbi:MAG: DUF983 domain-containing protein [Acidobacteriia bacterium]|nr:DUF983 domain-containing protein [Terriglobia bacterium]
MANLPNSEVAKASGLGGILHQLCPRCGQGKIFCTSIFRLFPRLNERCPVCGLKFEREQGYFLGAMVVSYILAIMIIPLLAAIIWVITRWDLNWVVIASVLLFIPVAPALSSFSRVLYIYFDQAIDPDES